MVAASAKPGQPSRRLLVAPCGMDCAVCSGYLAFANAVPRRRGAISHCAGCRIRGKRCAYLKGHCRRLALGRVEFCYECPEFPCARLRHLDERYARTYGMSLIGNLELIRDAGFAAFAARQRSLFGCPACGALRSVHNGQCFACERVSSWRRPAGERG